MVHQTKVENGRHEPPGDALKHSVNDFKQNLISLAELQLNLFTEDVKQGAQLAKSSVVMLGIALVLLLGAAPVLLAGAALGLTAATGWHLGISLAVVASAAVFIGLLLARTAAARLPASLAVVNRSRDELKQNIQWLKAALHSSTQKDDRAASNDGFTARSR